VSRTLRFGPLLGLICLGALGVRIAYALHQKHFLVGGDALTFHQVGQELADGFGFKEVLPPFGPTAEHPPLFELFLAVVDKLGANSYEAHRLILGAVGTVNVALIGLLGRALANWRTGLVAAAIAALYPLLWTADGALMSETLYGTFILCALLAAVWLARKPGPRPALLFGLLVGLAALTRGEGLALLVLLGLPLCLRGAPAWRGRGALVGAMVGATVLVLLPWTIRNLDAFKSPVLISTNSNGLFIGANCPATYHGPLIGSWRFQCYTPRRPGEDEAQYFVRERDIGLRYAEHHLSRLPAVLAARLGRILDVYQFGQSLFLNGAEGRNARAVKWGIRIYWVCGLLALFALGLLWRRRERTTVLILGAPIAMVILVGLITYGGTRFRYAAEPSIVVLAAITLTAAAGALRARAAARRAPPRPA